MDEEDDFDHDEDHDAARTPGTPLPEQWRLYQEGCARIKKERERAIALRLCHDVLKWLDESGPAPQRDAVMAALKCRPRAVVFLGAKALEAMASRSPDHWPVILWMFRASSLAAADEFFNAFAPPTPLGILRQLCEAGAEHHDYSIRRRAVEMAYWWDVFGFEDLLKSVEKGEIDEQVLLTIRRYRSIKKCGYFASFDRMTWSWQVDWRMESGLMRTEIPKFVVQTLGIDRAMEHVRASHDRDETHVAWDEIVDGA